MQKKFTMFNKIGAVILLVGDLKESIEFYRDVLGMQLKQNQKIGSNFPKAVVPCLLFTPQGKVVARKRRNVLAC